MVGALLETLRLDLVYVRTSMPELQAELVHFSNTQPTDLQVEAMRKLSESALPSDARFVCRELRVPAEPHAWMVSCLRLGIKQTLGTLVAGSRRADFPTELESLTLLASAHELAVTLHEARSQAAASHSGLASLLAHRDELAAELSAMTRLHEVSARLLGNGELSLMLLEVLDATIELQSADLGIIQLYDVKTRRLEVAAQRGFDSTLLARFRIIPEQTAAERSLIEDVAASEQVETCRELAEAAGFRALQSTPLLSRSGERLGVLTTYFREPHRPSVRDLRFTDLYARQASELIEREKTRDSLRRAEEELTHVARVMTMGELTASIAHEVNQPLTAVVTNANACTRWLKCNPANVHEANLAAQRIARDANRASEVIARIRTLMRREEPHNVELNVFDIIRDVVSLVQGEARAHGVTLRLPIPKDLPRIVGDRVQLQQLILNLALNAIEAMQCCDSGERTLAIEADQFARDQICISVRDSGQGIEKQHRDHIFEPFYTTKSKGMGMGLAICRSIVHAHGGRIWATPNENGGETFQFTFPVASSSGS